MRRMRQAGFTLLEVVVAMAILGLSLMAIFDLNAGAVSMHTYAKKVTVASLLARSKYGPRAGPLRQGLPGRR